MNPGEVWMWDSRWFAVALESVDSRCSLMMMNRLMLTLNVLIEAPPHISAALSYSKCFEYSLRVTQSTHPQEDQMRLGQK